MRRRLLSLITFLISFFPVFLAAGQEKNKLQFIHIGKEKGLESPYIGDIIQDDQDFLWICTWNSQLYRYDGINFKMYRHNPADPESLPAAQYTQMLLDKNKQIWLSSGNGLVVFNLETEKFTRYQSDPANPDSLSGNQVMSLFLDYNGTIWIGTYPGGLNAFNQETGKFTRYMNNPADPDSIISNNVTAIGEDQTGVLWISTDKGLDSFDRQTGKFSHFKYESYTPEGYPLDSVVSIINDKAGILWLATGNALKSYDPVRKEFKKYILKSPGTEYPMGFNIVYEGIASGKLWVMTYWGSLYEFDRQKEEFVFYAKHDPADPASFNPAGITVMLEDRSGMLWLTGAGGFLNAAKLFKKEFYSLQFNPGNPGGFQGTSARAFAEDSSGMLWIASAGGGLQVWDRKSGRIVKRYKRDPTKPDSPLIDDITSIFIDKPGDIWLTTNFGLYRLNPQTGVFYNYKNSPYGVSYLYEDSKGTIWAIGYGASRYDREKNLFIPFKSDPADPTSMTYGLLFDICEDQSGVIWIASSFDGLIRYNRETDNFTYYRHDPKNLQSLPSTTVFTVFEDKKRNLWLACLDGLVRFNRETGEFLLYDRSNGLGSSTIYDILEDDSGKLWVITQAGVTKFDPYTGVFKNYDTTDGLLSGDYYSRAYQSSDGYIFFGGGGVNFFYPPGIKDNQYAPHTVIFDLKLFNKSVLIGETEKGRVILSRSMPRTGAIELRYSDYVFSLEFAALSFVDAARNQYTYKLEGFDADWNYSGTRNFATYTNLSAGSYTFRVKAANNDGYWSEEAAALKIRVLPPFWETWWFRTLMLLSFTGIIAFIFIYTIVRLKTKHKAQLVKHEVEIARNIQLALLPDISLTGETGYDFAGSMLIADSVGGDYYDVTRGLDGRLWLGIGDVSGHGISAGLVMMMAQVAIHNLLGNVAGITPAELLTQANKIMTRNIRERMKTDQHMTINFLVETGPGCFDYAGAHEVILIHRAETGEIVQVDTDGFWLGILEDCAFQMSRGKGSFRLDKGDTLLLYTDGVIETMNREREQFDLKRLMNVMKYNCEHPARLKRAIINALLQDFGGIQKDDITFLICKRRQGPGC